MPIGQIIKAFANISSNPRPVKTRPFKFEVRHAVKWLIDNGANVNAASSLPFDIPNNANSRNTYTSCSTYTITTGKRTALMYAISEATKPVVTALIAAGANLNAQDSIGRNSVNYLKKRGPYGIQSLSKDERLELLEKIHYGRFRIPLR